MAEYKVVVVGDGKVGKTSFVQVHRLGACDTWYTPTMGAEVHPIVFKTTRGPVTLKMWDTAGQAKLAGLVEGYYVGADAAILMYSTDSQDSYNRLTRYDELLTRVVGNVPRVVVGGKSDLPPQNINLTLPYPHCTISNYGGDVGDPIDLLLQALSGATLLCEPESASN